MTKLVINPSKKQSKINKEIYGHFSEHLGRCIYEGIYVGEDSPIPNKNGMRTDCLLYTSPRGILPVNSNIICFKIRISGRNYLEIQGRN